MFLKIVVRANRDIEPDTDLWLEYRAKTSPVSDEYDESEENNTINKTNNGEEETSGMNEDDDEEENEEEEDDDVGYDEMMNESLNLKYAFSYFSKIYLNYY